jgi:hypothetical protein
MGIVSDITGRGGLRACYQDLCINICNTYLDRELKFDRDTMMHSERAVKKDFSHQQESYPTCLVETVSKHATRAAASMSATCHAYTRGSPCKL